MQAETQQATIFPDSVTIRHNGGTIRMAVRRDVGFLRPCNALEVGHFGYNLLPIWVDNHPGYTTLNRQRASIRRRLESQGFIVVGFAQSEN